VKNKNKLNIDDNWEEKKKTCATLEGVALVKEDDPPR
jgi:hypothetical protein